MDKLDVISKRETSSKKQLGIYSWEPLDFYWTPESFPEVSISGRLAFLRSKKADTKTQPKCTHIQKKNNLSWPVEVVPASYQKGLRGLPVNINW